MRASDAPSVASDVYAGRGRFTYSNGDVYDGQYVNDKRQGKGAFIYADGDRYEGDWNNGRIEGYGVYVYEDGERYEGEWRDEAKHGKGVNTYVGGDIVSYEGNYIDGGEGFASLRLSCVCASSVFVVCRKEWSGSAAVPQRHQVHRQLPRRE